MARSVHLGRSVSETFEKPPALSLRVRQSPLADEAISKHIDNPQDCHVALLLAMTKIEQNGGCAKLSAKKLFFCQFLDNNHEICGNSQKLHNNWLSIIKRE